MCKNIVIYGASGLAKEVYYMIKTELSDEFNVIGFIVDDEYYDSENRFLYNIPIYKKKYIIENKRKLGVVLGFSDTKGKQKIHKELSAYDNLYFPKIISSKIIIPDDSSIGEGSIIKGGTAVSVNVKIGKFVLMNGSVFVGHDTTIGDYVSVMPRSSISGNVTIDDVVFIGAHSFIIEKKSIGNNSVLAPGSIVFTDVPANVTVMGNPATILVRHNDHKNKNC